MENSTYLFPATRELSYWIDVVVAAGSWYGRYHSRYW